MGSREKRKTANLFRRVICRSLAKPEELTVSQWAEKYRILDESSNLSGRWSNNITPYLKEIMDTFNQDYIREVYLCKGSQLGGTEVLINMLMYIIDKSPAPSMIVYPSDDLAKEISKERQMCIRDRDNTQARELAKYRVNQGAEGYCAMVMTKDQIIARRAYMRSILRVSYFWCKMNNEQLDSMRLFKMGEDFIVEDTDNRQFILQIERRP